MSTIGILRINYAGTSANPRDHVQIVRALRRVTGLSPVFLWNTINRWHGNRSWFQLNITPSLCRTHAGKDELRAVWMILKAYGVTILLPDEIFKKTLDGTSKP